ncbi:MAG: biotin synthase BioB [Gammaproteobacteria bacterium]
MDQCANASRPQLTSTPAVAHAGSAAGADPGLRHDWQRDEILALFHQPFNDLLYTAQSVHRRNFAANRIQLSTLLNIKNGGCPEDCGYCPQSARYQKATGLQATPMLSLDEVTAAARAAKAAGAQRFCMGAAWREPKDKDLDAVIDMIVAVKNEGLESCVTLGMLTAAQAERLQQAGLDYYNHNLDSSPEYYQQVISTRTYQDRLDTLAHVRAAGLHVCCGGIIGMGEAEQDRAGLLQTLANLDPQPESVPINMLVRVAGTPLAAQQQENAGAEATNATAVEPLELVRTIAVARILMPRAYVRLSAGRRDLSSEAQALCFLAGANSVFYGDRLLTTDNPDVAADQRLFATLGITADA